MTQIERSDIARTLDSLALALADHEHSWSDELRDFYERATAALTACDCKVTDSSASG